MNILRQLWLDEAGQDIAEYAVMLAVILVLVVGTIRLAGVQRQQRVLAGGKLDEPVEHFELTKSNEGRQPLKRKLPRFFV